ncbi:thioredoxin family protein [Sphingobacterium faecium]|uniref:thioredoxin family protein n=1 Tax=Sphingobacterium faecium TaxID=34087 RepID=UPI0032098414
MKYLNQIILLTIIILYPLSHYGQERIIYTSFQQLDSLLSVAPRETIIFIHTDWCSYCRKIEKEVFTKKEIAELINDNYYLIKLDAESVEEINFDQHTWKPQSFKKQTGVYHPLASILLTNQKMIFPTLLRYDKTFRLKSIKQKYLSPKELANFLR